MLAGQVLILPACCALRASTRWRSLRVVRCCFGGFPCLAAGEQDEMCMRDAEPWQSTKVQTQAHTAACPKADIGHIGGVVTTSKSEAVAGRAALP